jgi:hypothetical protein
MIKKGTKIHNHKVTIMNKEVQMDRMLNDVI